MIPDSDWGAKIRLCRFEFIRTVLGEELKSKPDQPRGKGKQAEEKKSLSRREIYETHEIIIIGA